MLFKEAVRLLKIERSDKIIYNNKKKMTEEKNLILFSQSQIYMVFVPYN